MNGKNGAVKKVKKRQRVVIAIVDTDDGKFSAKRTFEPSIKNNPKAHESQAVKASDIAWRAIMESLKNKIILPFDS